MNKHAVAAVAIVLLIFCAGTLEGADPYEKPTSVIQVVSVKWAANSPPEQREAALAGVEKMAAKIPGIKSLWLMPIHVEPRDFTFAFVIEFEDRSAAEGYNKHPAYLAWRKAFLPIQESVRRLQVTN